MNNQIIEVIEKSGVEKETKETLQNAFSKYFTEANSLAEKAKSIIVTDESEKEKMMEAREIRLTLRKIRTDADKKRAFLKQESLRYGKAVQGIYNIIEYIVKPLEEHLENQEKFIILKENKRKQELKEKRIIECEEYQEYIPFGLDFANMTEEDYKKLLNGAKIQKENRLAAEQEVERREKEEKERQELGVSRYTMLLKYSEYMDIPRIDSLSTMENDEFLSLKDICLSEMTKEKERREQIEKENRLLKEKADREAEENRLLKEAADKREREIAEKEKIEFEKKEVERIEKEKKEAAERQEKERIEQEKIEAEKKAQSAPDKEKLVNYINEIDSMISLLDLKTEEAKTILIDFNGKLKRNIQAVESKVINL